MPKPRQGGRGRVLLVEDNVLNQVVAVGMLGKLGYDADVVDNGPAAVEAAAGGAYAAVLMDCRLPGLDGYQATAEIRRREGAARHTPIVAMTASATPQDRDRCLAAGMDDHLTKPVLLADLRAVLARWLPQAPPAAGAAGAATDALDRDRLAALTELDEDGQGSSLLTRLAAAGDLLGRLERELDRLRDALAAVVPER